MKPSGARSSPAPRPTARSRPPATKPAPAGSITGTEYLGAEIFRTFCQNEPDPLQPAKVRVSATSHGNRVTGNEVGRSEKVTGDEPGTCKNVTGTEYISANQARLVWRRPPLPPARWGTPRPAPAAPCPA